MSRRRCNLDGLPLSPRDQAAVDRFAEFLRLSGTPEGREVLATDPQWVRYAHDLVDLAGEVERQRCTNVAASWCPIHGDCACPEPDQDRDDPGCPLHAPTSTHGGTP